MPASRPLVIRFWEKVPKGISENKCWPWKGGHKSDGYGVINVGGRCESAHRQMWRFVNGEIPEGHHILHKCDNPPCVNPRHLWLGTHAQNMADMGNKGRGGSREQNGEKNCSAKLTWAKVDEIRSLAAAGVMQKEIAKHFGISRASVCLIVGRKQWASL